MTDRNIKHDIDLRAILTELNIPVVPSNKKSPWEAVLGPFVVAKMSLKFIQILKSCSDHDESGHSSPRLFSIFSSQDLALEGWLIKFLMDMAGSILLLNIRSLAVDFEKCIGFHSQIAIDICNLKEYKLTETILNCLTL